MKNLTDFIAEQLIMELSSDTYKNAYTKAKDMGDPRAEKFRDAYADALEKEDDQSDVVQEIRKWIKEDKPIIDKLKKLCGNDDLTFSIEGKKTIDGFDNPTNVKFYVGEYGKDQFLFRYFVPDRNKKDYTDFSINDYGTIHRVLNQELLRFGDSRGLTGKKFLVISARPRYSTNRRVRRWSEYYYDFDSRELRVDNRTPVGNDMPILKYVKKQLEDKLKEIGL